MMDMTLTERLMAGADLMRSIANGHGHGADMDEALRENFRLSSAMFTEAATALNAVANPFPAADGKPHYGKDCPAGMVQVEFVTVDPALRHNAYGWVPTDRRKILIDLYVDGVRFCINAGDIGEHCSDGVARRGIHIIGPMANIGNASLNAISYATAESESLPGNIHEEFRAQLKDQKEARLLRERADPT